jgi:hypothetical protein
MEREYYEKKLIEFRKNLEIAARLRKCRFAKNKIFQFTLQYMSKIAAQMEKKIKVNLENQAVRLGTAEIR